MKVLDLQCDLNHVFEGWFGSEDDFQSQLTRGLLTCPLCGNVNVTKKLSAPRLNLNTTRGDSGVTNSNASTVSSSADSSVASTLNGEQSAPDAQVVPNLSDVANFEPAQMQAALLKMVRHVVANTQDVGDRFCEEARKIHYGETQARNIRGHATLEQTEELIDEGIAVMPLPLADSLKEPLQ